MTDDTKDPIDALARVTADAKALAEAILEQDAWLCGYPMRLDLIERRRAQTALARRVLCDTEGK